MINVKKLLLVSMLLGLTSAAQAANNKLPNGKPFVILNDQVVEVENSIQELEDKYDDIIADIYGSINHLDGRVSAIDQKVLELQETDTQLQAKLDQAVSDLDSQGAEILTLVTNYQILTQRLEDLEKSAVTRVEFETLEAEIETVRNRIAGVSAEIAGLLSDIKENSTLIEQLKNEMKNLEVVMLNAIPEGECPDGQFLKEIKDDGTIVCANSASGTNPLITTLTSGGLVLNRGNLHALTLSCEPGQQVTSGGFRITGAQEGINVLQSFPWNNGWQVMVQADSNWKGGSLYVHVMCMGSSAD